MDGWALSLLLLYCLALAGVSLLGGWLPERLRLTHTRIQLVMSFVSGLMLGVGFYHLLPHSISQFPGANSVDLAIWWLMVGLILMLLLLRLFHFHQHDFSSVEQEHHHHGQHLPEDCPSPTGHVDPQPADIAQPLSWMGVAAGLTFHTVVDGIALGAAVSLDATGMVSEGQLYPLLGVGVFLAILLHKPLDSLSIVTLMTNGGWSRRSRRVFNLVFACICPLAALGFVFLAKDLTVLGSPILAVGMAFAAGAFICIALSDLLPEVHFHSHDRGKLSLAFVLGLVLAYGLGEVESWRAGPGHANAIAPFSSSPPNSPHVPH